MDSSNITTKVVTSHKWIQLLTARIAHPHSDHAGRLAHVYLTNYPMAPLISYLMDRLCVRDVQSWIYYAEPPGEHH